MSGALTIGLSLLAQSTLLLSLGLVAAWLLRRRGPALRAFVLQVTLAGVVLGSLLSVCLAGRVHPLWQIRAAPTLPSPIRTGDSESGMGEGSEPASIASVSSLPVLPPSTSGQGKGPEVGAGPEGVPPRHSSWPTRLTALWLTGSGLSLLWLALCQGHLLALRRRAAPLTDGWAAETLARLSEARQVHAPRLFASPHVRSPFLARVWRPAVFLPATWDTDYDDTTLHVILAHELAHHTRRDCAWTLLLRLTTALLWPQPLLRLLGRRLDQATEEACDLLALTPDCLPHHYADALLTLAERNLPSHRERTVSLGVIPLRSSLGLRIQNVLDRRNLAMITPSTRLRRIVTFGTCVMAAVLSAAFASSPGVTTSDPTPHDSGPTAAQVKPLQGRPSNADRGRKYFGYGIMWGPFPKHMRWHQTGYFLNASKGSPAAEAGIPTYILAKLITINGHSTKGPTRAVAALFRLPPPLHIVYIEADGQVRRATLRSKAVVYGPILTYTTKPTFGRVKREQPLRR